MENRNDDTIKIHGFADASIQAYAVAVYIRVVTSSFVSVKLLSAKSKVAPMKLLTVPRLELTSCLLLSVKSTISAFCKELNVKTVLCWTDSAVAYYWITHIEKEWKTRVENRVNRIREIIPANTWRHVPGTNNPADLETRELSPTSLIDNNMWWQGPEFLKFPENHWPEIPTVSAITRTW